MILDKPCPSCGFQFQKLDLKTDSCLLCSAIAEPAKLTPQEWGVVWAPETSQMMLNHLVRTCYFVITNGSFSREDVAAAQKFSEKLQKESNRIDNCFLKSIGKRSFDVLLLSLNDESFAPLSKGLRIIPKDIEQFPGGYLKMDQREGSYHGYSPEFISRAKWFSAELEARS